MREALPSLVVLKRPTRKIRKLLPWTGKILLSVVEYYSQREPAAIANPADPVAHVHPVKTARTFKRPIARGKQYRRTLFEHDRIAF
jgi:hypothetical protein